MTLVLCLCLGAVIIGTAAFAAFRGGLPGMSVISDSFQKENTGSSSEEPPQSEDGEDTPLVPDIIIEPDPENGISADNTESSGPIVYAAPDRMMAITISAGGDFFTD